MAVQSADTALVGARIDTFGDLYKSKPRHTSLLQMMKTTLFRKPPGYIVAALVCSLGGFIFGIDTGSIGPVTVMDDFRQYIGEPSPTVHGLIVSSILIPAAVSSFFAGRLAEALGRSRGIAIGSSIFALGAAMEAASVHIAMFIVGRVVEGLGEGIYFGTLISYVCEISPPRHRGALTTAPQLLTTIGLVTGFFTCYGTADIQSSFQWRLPFLLLAAYAALYTAIILVWLPPSPRWLSLHGRHAEAERTWERLEVAIADREHIMEEVVKADIEQTDIEKAEIEKSDIETPNTEKYDSEKSAIQKSDIESRRHSDTECSLTMALSMTHENRTRRTLPKSKKDKLLDVFAPDARVRLILAVFLMGMQQLSGIDGVLYYAPLLFQQAGLNTNQSTFLASGVSAIVIFAVTIPATLYADQWGRRITTIVGGLGMTVTMFLMGGLYAGGAVHDGKGVGRWVVIVCIYLFVVIFCLTWAVSMKLYAAEIQPQRTRASATSIAHGSNWITNFLVALFTPALLANSSYGAYFLFGACTLFTALVCCVFMPETRGKSLDEIDVAFNGRSPVEGLGKLRTALKTRLGRGEPPSDEV